MLIIFIIFFFQALITFMIKDHILLSEFHGILIVAILFSALSLYLFKVISKKWLSVIYLGLVLRVAVMLIDIYVPSISIFGSGTDSAYFHTASLKIANGEMALSNGRTFYVTLLSAVYYLFGEQRIVAQFLNIVFWVFSTTYLIKILYLHKVNEKNIMFSIVIFTFMPNIIFMTSILLRESIIIFFFILSLYNFFRWIKDKKFSNFLIAVIFILISMLFHAGMIGILISYIVVLAFFQKRSNIKNKKLYLAFFVILVIMLLANEELFLSKFVNVQENGLEGLTISNSGSSAYLQSFIYLNSWQVFLLTPLKMVYFLFSPLPLDWRGMSDVISFSLDSLIYLLLFSLILFNLLKSPLEKKVKIALLIMIFISVFIFSYGTGNSGTAMRHRTKLLPLFIITYCLVTADIYKRKKNMKNCKKKNISNKNIEF